MSDSDKVPDYSDEPDAPVSDDAMKRLTTLVVKMSQLELREMELEADLKECKKELRQYEDNLIPELMQEMGTSMVRTAAGTTVEVKEDVRASFPKDEGRQATAFRWLRESGNDGIIKREITVRYGRDSTEWADALMRKMEEWGVAAHGVVEQEWSIHHQTLLSFIRTELKEGRDVPLEAFGAFVARTAKIKRPK